MIPSASPTWQSGKAPPQDPEERLLSMRLPASEVGVLRFLFGGLESQVGLGSNFGAMCERLAAGKVRQEQHRGGRFEPLRWNGVLVARGVEEQSMYVHKDQGSTYCTSQVTPAEAWACWGNHTDESLGRAVLEARAALVRVIGGGGSRHVVILHAMYSGSTPASHYSDFRALGDLAPLARYTDQVARRAERDGLDPHEALHALLDYPPGDRKRPGYEERRAARTKTASAIKVEAHRLLVRASTAYLLARDAG